MYLETGWQPLSDRRKLSKLTTMHKIHNSCVPKYLSEIIPNTRGNDSAYRTRNNENYTLPKCRLDAFKKSFVPDTIHIWNSVSLDIRRETSVNKFKTLLSGLYQTGISKPPSYYSFGKRKLNIIHTKLRHCCILNHDLHKLNIVVSDKCSCGAVEDAYHFFFNCKNYTNARNKFLLQLLQQDHFRVINTHLLLWGDESLSNDINNYLFYTVHTLIQESGRFI